MDFRFFRCSRISTSFFDTENYNGPSSIALLCSISRQSSILVPAERRHGLNDSSDDSKLQGKKTYFKESGTTFSQLNDFAGPSLFLLHVHLILMLQQKVFPSHGCSKSTSNSMHTANSKSQKKYKPPTLPYSFHPLYYSPFKLKFRTSLLTAH